MMQYESKEDKTVFYQPPQTSMMESKTIKHVDYHELKLLLYSFPLFPMYILKRLLLKG